MGSFKRICYLFFTLVTGIVGFTLLEGCTSLRNEVDPGQLGLASPKLVVSGFLSPQDTVFAIKVTQSSTVVGDSISLLQTGNDITNATVTLAEGDRTVTLLYNNRPASSTAAQPYYSASTRLLPIIAGRTYKLTVVTPNGQRASSTCTIPDAVFPKAITFDSIDDTQNRTSIRRYFVRAQWQDPPGRANYYQLAGIFRFTTSTSTTPEEKYNSLSFDDDNRGLFTDAGLDGTTFESGRAFIATSSSSSQQSSFNNQYKTALVTINLMSVDPDYYRFQEATIRQRRSRNNPFAEPVAIPSNIEGGLGCFAGYNSTTLTKRLN